MGFYGREHVYFHCEDKRFFNTVWIELIGFDNTQPDYGVGQFVEACWLSGACDGLYCGHKCAGARHGHCGSDLR